MKTFMNMKIGTRLGIGFGLILALLLLMGAIGIGSMKKINQNLEQIVKEDYGKIQLANGINAHVVSLGEKFGLMTMADQSARGAIKQDIDKIRAEYKELMNKLEQRETSDKGKELIAAAKLSLENGKIANNKVVELSLAGRAAEAQTHFNSVFYPLHLKAKNAFNAIVDYQEKLMATSHAEATAAFRSSLLITIAIIIAAVLAGIITSYYITKSITRPISDAVKIANALADGDLAVDAQAKSRDEMGQLMEHLRKMVHNLRDMIATTVEISSGIAAASNQLHSTSTQIATGAEEVSYQANTVATASEEMSATSIDIARNCSMAADASRQTIDSANAGAHVVNETSNGMNIIVDRVRHTSKTIETLGVRSDQIGEIVGTIEDIADQTNLLALNAAIEAARAGEQGRGFAVVADEVRALAERTTKATHEIGEMIKAIQRDTHEAVKAMDEGVREVEKGAESSRKSGLALEEILERINEVTMQVNQIATAAEEQTATTGEVTSNIQQINEVVHITAQGAEETANAAAQLAGQAQQLQTLVGRFRI